MLRSPALRFPALQAPVNPRSLDLHFGPLGPQVDPRSLDLKGEAAQPGFHDYHENPWFDDPNPANRIQDISLFLQMLHSLGPR